MALQTFSQFSDERRKDLEFPRNFLLSLRTNLFSVVCWNKHFGSTRLAYAHSNIHFNFPPPSSVQRMLSKNSHLRGKEYSRNVIFLVRFCAGPQKKPWLVKIRPSREDGKKSVAPFRTFGSARPHWNSGPQPNCQIQSLSSVLASPKPPDPRQDELLAWFSGPRDENELTRRSEYSSDSDPNRRRWEQERTHSSPTFAPRGTVKTRDRVSPLSRRDFKINGRRGLEAQWRSNLGSQKSHPESNLS